MCSRRYPTTGLPAPLQRPRVPVWSGASLPARAGVRRAARWDGIVPVYATESTMRPVTPDEVAAIVDEIRSRRVAEGPFDVVVWAVAPDAGERRRYEEAGATWLVEGPAPGEEWLDDALAIAAGGPPAD